jgi:hypothetical protein
MMDETNPHVRAACAHLARATRPTFIDDTMLGLLDEIGRLRNLLKRIDDVTIFDGMPLAEGLQEEIEDALGIGGSATSLSDSSD